MAHKRMFSKDITGSDAFREMPASSQSLYFHLGMEADDDGFLDSYRGLMRSTNASDDDLKLLIAKRFLILFPSKIIVVKHWKLNNYIPKDRYTETKHLDEKRGLLVKDNGSYTECIQDVHEMDTQKRIEENRKEEKSLGAKAPEIRYTIENEEEDTKGSAEVILAFKEVNPHYMTLLNRKNQHAASKRMIIVHGLSQVLGVARALPEINKIPYLNPITTPIQLEADWGKIQAKLSKRSTETSKPKGRGVEL